MFGSLYGAKQVSWISLRDGTSGVISLPKEARGPVQLYPTPDSKYLYVADQGYYFNQPKGNSVYRINIADKDVDATIVGGTTPHGVVVSKNGTRIYVTNLLSGDVSVIDSLDNREIARIPVGTMPNGISIWHTDLGGTP
jgi:YVTN family beta-propeller protein